MTLYELLHALAHGQDAQPLREVARRILALGGRISGTLSTCIHCGTDIYSARGLTRYCGNACRVKSYRQRERIKRDARRDAERSTYA